MFNRMASWFLVLWRHQRSLTQGYSRDLPSADALIFGRIDLWSFEVSEWPWGLILKLVLLQYYLAWWNSAPPSQSTLPYCDVGHMHWRTGLCGTNILRNSLWIGFISDVVLSHSAASVYFYMFIKSHANPRFYPSIQLLRFTLYKS